MLGYLFKMGLHLKDFAAHAQDVTARLREAFQALARRTGRPIRYLASSTTNEEEIAQADGTKDGLICILTVVEPCQS
jgi:hypothetical protein